MMLNSLGDDGWAAMETISWNSFDNTNVFSAFFFFFVFFTVITNPMPTRVARARMEELTTAFSLRAARMGVFEVGCVATWAARTD